jgi:hypothetical protein
MTLTLLPVIHVDPTTGHAVWAMNPIHSIAGSPVP